MLFGTMLVWGLFGFWAGDAYQRHDWVRFGVGFGLWVVFPIGIVAKRLLEQVLWRREWERRYHRKWSESEAARFEKERGS